MFQLDKTIVSEELFEKDFVCNLSACKGFCCVDGDAGAPVTNEEAKIMEANELKVDFEDVKESAKNMIKVQMAQFGQMNPSDKELEDIAARVLSNQDEVRRLSEQVVSQKLLNLYKEKANIKTKELTYEKFVKEVYGDK